MAVVIPSKNIYNVDNSKIKNNTISKVSVGQSNVSSLNEYGVLVHGEKKETGDTKVSAYIQNQNLQKNSRETAGGGLTTYNVAVAFASYEKQYLYKSLRPKFPVLKDNSWINNLKTGTSYNETTGKQENNIKVAIYGKVESGKATGTFNWATETISNVSLTQEAITDYQFYEIPDSISAKVDSPIFATTATANKIDVGNIGSVSYSIVKENGQDYYSLDLEIFCDCTTVMMTGLGGNVGSYPATVNINGDYKRYIASQVEVSIYGNTFGISVDDGTVEYGNGKSPQSIERNEIVQNNAKTYGIPTTQYIADRILQKYKDGKETAVLKCSISDYFDENGELVISADGKIGAPPDRMTFQNGDEVIPMVCGADGKDRPLSQKNGSPKVFKVLGVKCFYDGAVWQEISLQEI